MRKESGKGIREVMLLGGYEKPTFLFVYLIVNLLGDNYNMNWIRLYDESTENT